MRQLLAIAAAITFFNTSPAAQARKETVEGIRNFTVLDATVACAGATEPRVFRGLKERGYKSIVNLREATEGGAAIPESRAMASDAGLKFIHLPFNSTKPDESVVANSSRR